MHRLVLLPAVTVLALAVAACQPAAPPAPAGLSAADRAAIDSISHAFEQGMLANDPDAVAATYAPDATLMPPGHEPVEGRAAIREFLATFPPITSFTLVTDELEGVGDLAYVRGHYSMTFAPPGGGPVTDEGKFLEVRRRQPDGTWPYLRDMYSSNRPAAAEPAAKE